MASFVREVVLEQLCCVLRITPTQINHHGNFPSHGGNSISAVALASRCKREGIDLSVISILQSQSIHELVSSGTVTKDSRNCLQGTPTSVRLHFQDSQDRHVQAQDSSCGTQMSQSSSDRFPGPAAENGASNGALVLSSGRLSFAGSPPSELQLSLLHGTIKKPGVNVIRHSEIYRTEHISAIKAAWQKLFAIEAILRTSFSADLQIQSKSYMDWTETATENETDFNGWVNTPVNTLVLGSKWEVVHLTSKDKMKHPPRSAVIWTIHHALIDGYSAQLLLQKLRETAAGKAPSNGTEYISILKDLDMLRNTKKNAGDAFWTAVGSLYGRCALVLQLPQPRGHCNEAGVEEHHIRTTLSRHALEAISKHCGVTSATIYYAAWTLVMTVVTDCDDIAFGTALLGRNLPLPGIEDAIGPFFNTLPFAISARGDMTLRTLLTETFHRVTDIEEYQWFIPNNEHLRNFRCALMMQFDLSMATRKEAIHPIEPPVTKQTSDIPLAVLVGPETICFQYNKAEFNTTDIEGLGVMFDRALQSFLRLEMTVTAWQTSLITAETHEVLRRYGNCTSSSTSPLSITADLITLFEKAVVESPDGIALEAGGTQLTYSMLDEQVDNVAQTLRTTVKHQEIVCVDADRTVNWIIAILAVLKVGAIYCPLDSELPNAARVAIFNKTSSRAFLCSSRTTQLQAPPGCEHSLVIEELLDGNLGRKPAVQQSVFRDRPDPSATAYLCFTSGSSGTPKGVICSHEGLVAFQRDLEVRLFALPGIRISQIMSPAFDGSIHEIFSALCYGATLVLPSGDNVLGPLSRAHSAILTPSIAQVLQPEDYPDLRHVYLVGEPVKQSVNDRWASAKLLYNMYGPTEGTCGATIKRLLPTKPVTIGRPNPSTRVYILNSRGGHMPPGAIGDIHVAGVQVARGYLDLPVITTQCFLPDPFCSLGNQHMYKTGDRGYWTPNGEIVCLGRVDRQIKLRGFRLDLDDLEIRLGNAIPGLRSVVVVRRQDILLAFIQPSTLDPGEVRVIIAKTLPSYAQPRHIFMVDHFPTTSAGKLDYKKMASDNFSAPPGSSQLRTPLEVRIAELWRQVLRLNRSDQIGSKSNFFELGGNSVLQMTLLARLSSIQQARIPLKIIIESQTLGDLAGRVEDLVSEMELPRPATNVTLNGRTTSFLEQDWWMRYQFGHPNHSHLTISAFNVSFVTALSPGMVDTSAMGQAWDMAMSRYPLFRSRYVRGASLSDMVQRHYAEGHPRAQHVQEIDVRAEVNRPFDLACEPPVRILLSASALVVVMSHIVGDLTTFKILLQDVKSSYKGDTMAPVKRLYEDSFAWEEDAPPAHLDFWSVYLDKAEFQRQSEPMAKERKGFGGTSKVYQLYNRLTARMLRFSAKQENLSLQQLANAAVGLVLEADQDETDIVIGNPFMNRSNDLEMETVGLFLQPFPVRVRYVPPMDDNDAKPYLDAVQQSVKAALIHVVPWHSLLEHLEITPRYPKHPLFDVMVTFHHSETMPTLDVPGTTPCYTWSEGSKFSLMAEFTTLERGVIILRVEYDNQQYTGEEIDHFVTGVSNTLWKLLSNISSTTIKDSLRSGALDHTLATAKADVFGKPVKEISKSCA
ncbi:Uu.00g118310.m01.CDS01 [Anthostomella pinea]|uniref:Uu.00g118310.m01.CDS01 n=1 Tax=Anthostomella pinea TaxID=933095 RepID=A0AAI8VGF5_9PEZI|nr:Uu.00g118310.m01.CDS01 [Anthostomella pinea]